METISELAQLSEARLVECFGQAYGHYLNRAARGIDDSPLLTHWKPDSLSGETTLDDIADDWTVSEQMMLPLREIQILRSQSHLTEGR